MLFESENRINKATLIFGKVMEANHYVSYNSPTPEALELFIPVLLEKGYKFVVVSELIGQ